MTPTPNNAQATAESWDTDNDFLLHGSVDRVSKILARYELFKRVMSLPGDVVEGGVLKGVGVLSWAKLIQLIKGDATRTIPEYLDRHPGFRVALLNLDFDAYDPTAVALERLYPRVVPGGVVLFDDYGIREYGESDAVDAFFRGAPAVYQALPWALSPRAYLIKPATASTSAADAEGRDAAL